MILFNIAYRFSILFSHDSDSMPRVWTGNEDIRAITKTARSSVRHCLRLVFVSFFPIIITSLYLCFLFLLYISFICLYAVVPEDTICYGCFTFE